MLPVRRVQGSLPRGLHLARGVVMHAGRGVVPDPGVPVLMVVVSDESFHPRPGVVDRVEPFGVATGVFHGFELGLRKRIVIARAGPGMRPGDVHVHQHGPPWGYRFNVACPHRRRLASQLGCHAGG